MGVTPEELKAAFEAAPIGEKVAELCYGGSFWKVSKTNMSHSKKDQGWTASPYYGVDADDVKTLYFFSPVPDDLLWE